MGNFNRYKCCSIICFILGTIFFALTIAWLPVLNYLKKQGSIESASLTQQNEDSWKDIPGKFDIDINHKNYFYDCINSDDVIYKGAKPVFEEYGPFNYRETQNYTEVQYNQNKNVTGLSDSQFSDNVDGQKEAIGLDAIYNQYTSFDQNQQPSEPAGLNVSLNIINQAAMGVWYGQLFADKWRFYIVLLYNTVNDLGRQLTEAAVYQELQQGECKSVDEIGKIFPSTDVPFTNQQLNAIYNDQVYGLISNNSYEKWGALNPFYQNDNTTWSALSPLVNDYNKQLIFEMQLKSYFNFSQAQVDQFKSVWQNLTISHKETVLEAVPGSQRRGEQVVGFYQWSQGYITNLSTPQNPQPSVTKISDTVSGYPEISYWRDEYFCKKISQQNQDLLCQVQFSNIYDADNDLIQLFNLSSPSTLNNDPEASSLFNITTLKNLIKAGENSISIIQQQDVSFEDAVQDNLMLWQQISNDTGFCQFNDKQVSNISECDVKHVYMLYLWMDTLFNETFQRASEGGNVELGVIPTLGSLAFKQYIEYMQLEMPIIVYAHQLNQTLNQLDTCQSFYNQFDFSSDQISLICETSNQFQDVSNYYTFYKLVNIHFYGKRFNPQYYEDLMTVLQTNDTSQIENLLRSSDSTFYKIIQQNVIPSFAQFYNSSHQFCAKQENQVTNECSWAQIFLGQWISSNITENPIDSMQKFIDDYKKSQIGQKRNESTFSYRRLYPNVTMMNGNGDINNQTDFTPETKYFTKRAEIDDAFSNINNQVFVEIWNNFNDDHLFNQEMWGDLYLNQRNTTHTIFNTQQFIRYMKYVTIQAGLNGMFTQKTAKSIIEGYNDTLVQQLISQPVYTGGDQTQSSLLSFDQSPTNPVNNPISFLSGQTGSKNQSYLFTRQYVKWLNLSTISLKYKDYTSLSTVEDVYINPWLEQIEINGTDGNQFHPLVEQDEILDVFVSDLARIVHFVYKESDFTTYQRYIFTPIEMMKFYLSDEDLLDKDSNSDNKKYNTIVNGTCNMNSVLKAQSIGTKGHYLNVSDQLSLPKIIDHNKQLVNASLEDDNTMLGIEKYSGVVVQALQRFQISFQINGSSTDPNGLFSQFQNFDPVMPFAYVKRESIMSQSQIDQIFGDLITLQYVKIPLFVLFMILGFMLFIFGGCYCKKGQDINVENRKYSSLLKKNQIDESVYKNKMNFNLNNRATSLE